MVWDQDMPIPAPSTPLTRDEVEPSEYDVLRVIEGPGSVDRHLTQQMQISPYHLDHRSYRSKRTRDEVDPAIYEVIGETKRMSISLSILYRHH